MGRFSLNCARISKIWHFFAPFERALFTRIPARWKDSGLAQRNILMERMSIQFGVDRFLADDRNRQSGRFALVTNNSACTASYVPSRLALLSSGCRLVKLFSPEHGLQAIGADGHPMASGTDRLTSLPFTSLYGDELEPSATALSEVDAVLFDLSDVGCRCYTYLWTLSCVMEACSRHGKTVILLDRPNPISGLLSLAEGPGLDESNCSSFIGRWNIPLRHSCTYGELALLWKSDRLKDLDLQVVKSEGWSRQMFYHDSLSSFVPTSPAISNFDSCLLYAGLCLLEATNLSEGRGTGLAFRVAGAPWLDAIAMTEKFNNLDLPGVVARAVTFLPESGTYRGESCNGLMLHVTDMRTLRPVWLAVMLIKCIKDLHPESFAWSTYPTHVNPTGKRHLDKLLGIENAESLFAQDWDKFVPATRELLDCGEWESRVQSHLLYA
jgi:uncharacterized protein YbbC (DUF1343 family)